MSSIRNFIIRAIEEDRWHLWIPATAVAVVLYWHVVTLFLESANASIAKPLPDAFDFTRLLFHPKPFDVPVYLVGYLVVPLLALGLVNALKWLLRRGYLREQFVRNWPPVLLGSVLLFVLYKMILHASSLELWRQMPPRGSLTLQGLLVLSLLAGFVLAARHSSISSLLERLEKLPWSRLRWLVVIAVVVLVFSPNFPFDHDHYNDHLGPVNDLLHGKRFLQETHSSYGLLNTYALYGIFRVLPLSYQGLSLVLMLASIGWYLGWYALLRGWLRSEAVAAIAVLAMIVFFNIPLLNFDFAYEPPSHTPFHQLAFLVVAWLWFRYMRQGAGENLVLLATAAGFFWFVDTGLYLVLATLAVLIFRALGDTVSWQRRLATFSSQVGKLGLMIGGFAVAYSLSQYWQSGSWPSWALLYRDAGLYQSGYMLLPLPNHGLYYIYLFVFIVSLAYIVWQGLGRREGVRELTLPLFVVIFGILQMIYYINRPHSANLAPRMAVFLVLLVAWWYVTWQRNQASHPELTKTISALLAGLLIFTVLAGIVKFGVTFRTRDYVPMGQNYTTETFGRSDVYGGHAEVLDDIATLRRERASRDGRIALVHWFDVKILLELNAANALPIVNLQSVFRKSQMDEVIASVRRARPARLFVGRVGSPGFEPVRTAYRDKIEYFRRGVDDLYKLDRQLLTLDVLRRP